MKEQTRIDAALLVLRLIGGLVLFYYGIQKVIPVLGGYGFMATMRSFEQQQGIHPALAVCAILAESAGALGLMTGLLTRVAAFGIAVTMGVAASVHFASTDLFAAPTVKDFTYPILIGTIALAILIAGPGRFSLDARLSKKK